MERETALIRWNVVFLLLLAIGFMVVFSAMIVTLLDIKRAVVTHMHQVEAVLVAKMPTDLTVMRLLETQMKEIETLTDLSEEKARLATSIKNRQDALNARMTKQGREMKAMIEAERVARKREGLPPQKPAPRKSFLGGKPK